jgi:hypothetical protein
MASSTRAVRCVVTLGILGVPRHSLASPPFCRFAQLELISTTPARHTHRLHGWGNPKDPKMPHITTAFAPDFVTTMRWALDAASDRVPLTSRTPATKAKMAQRIVKSAHEGIRDAHQLVAAAVAEGMVPAL